MLDIVLITLGIIFLLIGLAGCILPVLPGPPISYVGILLLHFTEKHQFSSQFLIVWAIIAIVVTVLDNVIPIWGTKKYGGSKKAIWGSMIGLVLGLFLFPPFGIIIGPFAGAVIGELMDGKEGNAALRSGFGAFVGFLGGTLLKLVTAGMITFYFFKELIG
ncbi:DUF456 domain-containing protein [Roseimarinus sediminis]|jgi:hypothetical protein|uniref:DUF456 domain-containing protein n=1 Tax=Roseimarinus sediminis TaxID=1610899 RepID=UPI003D20C7BA